MRDLFAALVKGLLEEELRSPVKKVNKRTADNFILIVAQGFEPGLVYEDELAGFIQYMVVNLRIFKQIGDAAKFLFKIVIRI